MSETTETTVKKVRATLEGTKLTFPKTGFVMDIASIFPDYPSYNPAQQYSLEYAYRQIFQDVTATVPDDSTPLAQQKKRLDILLAGQRPTKASKPSTNLSLSALETGVFDLAVKSGDVSVITLLSTIPNGITKERAAELIAKVTELRLAAENPEGDDLP